jgi:hypothetical protein
LEVALLVLGPAVERDLWYLVAEHGPDGLVGDIAHLVVVLDHFSPLVTHATIARLHQGVTRLILRTDIAVETCPAFVAFASIPFA